MATVHPPENNPGHSPDRVSVGRDHTFPAYSFVPKDLAAAFADRLAIMGQLIADLPRNDMGNAKLDAATADTILKSLSYINNLIFRAMSYNDPWIKCSRKARKSVPVLPEFTREAMAAAAAGKRLTPEQKKALLSALGTEK